MKTQQCPSRQELTDFDHGRTSTQRGDEISDHLEHCDDCSAVLDSLEGDVDNVIGHLREQVPPAEIIKNDSEINRLVEAAERLHDTSVEGHAETLNEDSLSKKPPVGQIVSQILNPPESDDEIGSLGGYRVLDVLGVGGMGIVFKAEDPQLKRKVALKAMLPHVVASSDSARDRFLREAQATAAIHHDNIVTIHQVGQDRDVPFLAMHLLEGESLGARLRSEKQLPIDEACRIARETATGLAAAHAKGLTHRDVKPDNLWLESATGRVKILDFGLARATDDQQDLTQSGAVVGTPSYLAPEQALGASVDARADLFSLGVVFYQMLTGKKPFERESTFATLRAIDSETPKSPRELNKSIPTEVSDLVMRLLEKDASKRYQSAPELIAAIDACELSTEPTALAAGLEYDTTQPTKSEASAYGSQKTTSPLPKGERTSGRGKALIATAAAVLFLLAAAVIYVKTDRGTIVVKADGFEVTTENEVVTIRDKESGEEYTVRINQEKSLPSGNYELVVQDDRGLEFETLEFMVKRGNRQLEVALVPAEAKQDRSGSDTHLIAGPNPTDNLDPEAIPEADRYEWQPDELVAVVGEHRARGWGDHLRQLAVSPDGKTLACLEHQGTVRFWDAKSMRQTGTLKLREHSGSVFSFSPDGKQLIADKEIWNLTFSVPRRVAEFAKGTVSGVLSPNGNTVAFRVSTTPGGYKSDDTKNIYLCDISENKPTEKDVLKGHTATVLAIAWSSDGKTLASAGEDHSIRLWDMTGDEPKERAVLTGHKDSIRALAFISNEKLASAGMDNMVRLWDLSETEAKQTFVLSESEGPVKAIAVSPDGRLLATAGSGDGDSINSPEYPIFVYDLTLSQPQLLASLQGHADTARSLVFSTDSNTLYSTDAKYTPIRTWDVSGKKPKAKYEPTGHLAPLTSVAFSNDGKKMATARDGVRLWDLTNPRPREIAVLQGGSGPCHFSPDGRYLVAPAGFLKPWIWDLTAAKPVGMPLEAGEGAIAFAFSADGQVLAAGGNGTAQLWDLTGQVPKLRASLAGHEGGVRVAFSPNGETLATCSGDQKLRLWDLSSHEPTIKTMVDTKFKTVYGIAFSPSGDLLASTHEGNNLVLWDLTRQEPRRRVDIQLKSATGRPLFSPSEESLFVSTDSGTIVEFDLVKNTQTRSWTLPGAINDLTLSSDGWYLATANANGTAYILRLDGKVESSQSVESLTPIARKSLPPMSPLAMVQNPAKLTTNDDEVVESHTLDTVPIMGATIAALSPDGKQVATFSDDGMIRIWDPHTHELEQMLVGHTAGPMRDRYDATTGLSWNPDNRRLAVVDESGELQVWNTKTGETMSSYKHDKANIEAYRWSPDGLLLAVRFDDPVVRILDGEGALVREFEHPPGIPRHMAWAPDSQGLAVSLYRDDNLFLWDVQTGEGRRLKWPSRVYPDEHSTTSLAWSPDGRQIAATCGKVVAVCEVASGDVREVLNHEGTVAWSLDGSELFVGLKTGSTPKDSHQIVRIVPGKEIERIDLFQVADNTLRTPATSITPLSDGQHLLVKFYYDGNRLVNLETGESRQIGGHHTPAHNFIHASQDGAVCVLSHSSNVASAGVMTDAVANDQIRQWTFLPGNSASPINRIASSDQFVATFRRGGPAYLSLIDRSTGRPVQRFEYGGVSVYAIAFSPDRKTLFTAESNGRCVIRSLDTGDDVATFSFRLPDGPNQPSLAACYSPDGKEISVVGHGIAIFDSTDGTLKRSWSPDIWGHDVAWSPDGKLLAVANNREPNVAWHGPFRVRIFDAATGEEQALLSEFPQSGGSGLRDLTWSPDGKYLAATADFGTAGEEPDPRWLNQLVVWDTSTWKSMLTRPVSARALRFDDNNTLAYATPGGRVVYEDVESGKELRSVSTGADGRQVVFTTDGKQLLKVNGDRIRVWNLKEGRLQATLLPELSTSGSWAVVSPDGHYAGSPDAHKHLRHIVRTKEGTRILSPFEFRNEFDWQNDPSKVRLK